MSRLSLSEKYGIGAAFALFVVVLVDSPILMLVLAVAGLGAGMYVVWTGEAKRVAYVAAIAFALLMGVGLFRVLS